jgi:hypothetical protein
MRQFSMVVAFLVLCLVAVPARAGNCAGGNCTAGGVQVVQSVPVVQTFAVQQVVAAPVIASVIVPQVTQVVPVVQTFGVQAVHFQQVRAFGVGGGFGGGNVRQAGLFNVNGGRGGIRGAGFGGGVQQRGLINISR